MKLQVAMFSHLEWQTVLLLLEYRLQLQTRLVKGILKTEDLHQILILMLLDLSLLIQVYLKKLQLDPC